MAGTVIEDAFLTAALRNRSKACVKPISYRKPVAWQSPEHCESSKLPPDGYLPSLSPALRPRKQSGDVELYLPLAFLIECCLSIWAT